jgi:hypothetical protein
MISLLLRALSRNTSVTKLIICIDVVSFASLAFRELLTCTQTLQTLEVFGSEGEEFIEEQIAAIAAGFAWQDSKVKEVILYKVDNRTDGLQPIPRELGRNTTVTNLTFGYSVLSHEITQQLKAVIRQNMALLRLDLRGCLWKAGAAWRIKSQAGALRSESLQ